MNEYLTLGTVITLVSFMGIFTKIAWNISKSMATLVVEQAHAMEKIVTHEGRLGRHDELLEKHGTLLAVHSTLLQQRGDVLS